MKYVFALLLIAIVAAFIVKMNEKKQVHPVSLSIPLESFYREVFAPLDVKRSVDLTGHLETVRERILDAKLRVDPGEQRAFESAVETADILIQAARERTKLLGPMLSAVKTKAPLDPRDIDPNRNFFVQTFIRRWEEQKTRYKQHADEAFLRLRNEERQWNQHATREAAIDTVSVPRHPGANTKAGSDIAASTNPLDRGTYNDRRNPSRRWDSRAMLYREGR